MCFRHPIPQAVRRCFDAHGLQRLAHLWRCSCACFVGRALAKSPIDFGHDVAPIFEQHCIRCHQPSNKKAGLSLATFADLKSNEYVVPGDPDASYVVEVVTAASGDKPLMPKEGAPLSAQEISTLHDWIREGARWPEGIVVKDRARADQDWWSLRPLAAMEPPSAEIPTEWSRNPIDRFIYMRLAAAGLRPNPPADRPGADSTRVV